MDDFPISINLHLTNRCNYHCKFCFAQNRCLSRELTFDEWKKIIFLLSQKDCRKINFAGGEPTLLPFLPELIIYAKNLGFYTSIISNGSLISKKFVTKIKSHINLIGLSLDSPYELKEQKLGRGLADNRKASYSHVEQINQISNWIKTMNIPLKINTTLTSLTWMDNFAPLIESIQPIRWKVLEVHKIDGINNHYFDINPQLKKDQIDYFMERHEKYNPIYESSEILSNSYCIITPDGRFYFDQSNTYSPEILVHGIDECFDKLYYSSTNFSQRDGLHFLSDTMSKAQMGMEVKKTG
ncbi:PqqA peptide cyclase [Candidatus Lokiarchaeum ossiferum]|uniref:PqqA peptide cyclase n=1 Tax=Candidatus Lokiarchaeum ossiferum TaxID=2951803 RepID=A0ABY6HMZ9_9ARCH|nr:PqqA peptide cyclase [Candidatus Lokiarchaeum sp. B-35]